MTILEFMDKHAGGLGLLAFFLIPVLCGTCVVCFGMLTESLEKIANNIKDEEWKI